LSSNSTDNKKLQVITSSFTQKGVPARLTTFLAALLVAVVSTLHITPAKGGERRAGGGWQA